MTESLNNPRYIPRGYTLAELMIVLVIISILVALSLPAYTGFTIRTKVAEGLSLAATAKLAILETCIYRPGITIDNAAMGYPPYVSSKYVASIILGGVCKAPRVTISTLDTGGAPDPVLVLTGEGGNIGSVQWKCSLVSGALSHVPSSCRTLAAVSSDVGGGNGGGETAGTGGNGGGKTAGTGGNGGNKKGGNGGNKKGGKGGNKKGGNGGNKKGGNGGNKKGGKGGNKKGGKGGDDKAGKGGGNKGGNKKGGKG